MSITYTFTANPAGTYWYHSHNKGQYPDGLRGPLIVHDRPNYEDKLACDQEYILTLSDWYHQQLAGPNGLVHYYLGAANDAEGGAEPIAASGLINDKATDSFQIQPGKKYLFRVISFCALAAHFLQFDQHEMTIVAIDGVPVTPTQASTIYLSAAQRYDVIITGMQNPKKNYAFIAQMDNDMFDDPQPDNVTITNGALIYNSQWAIPPLLTTHDNPIDDLTLLPADGQNILGNPDQTIWLSLNFFNTQVANQTVQRGILGPYSYINPKVPTLYTALSTGQNTMNPTVYGSHVNPYVIQSGQIVDIVVNNLDTGGHPMHIHGHQPQVIYRSSSAYTNSTKATFAPVPMRRDTVKVDAGGSIIMRYQANNPGVFLCHCHIEWHVEAGVTVTLIEAPDKLQQSGLRIPQDHLAACQAQGIPTSGNCAGNTRNPLDTSQCATAFDPDPVGAYVSPSKKMAMTKRAAKLNL